MSALNDSIHPWTTILKSRGLTWRLTHWYSQHQWAETHHAQLHVYVPLSVPDRRQYPQLAAREDLVRRLVLEQYRQMMQKHSAAAVDGRAETHLQVAALLLASHKVLEPWIRDPQVIHKLLRPNLLG